MTERILPDSDILSRTSAVDRRVRRSRAALTTAFTELALERGYASIGVTDVATRASVGRSTLYTHFSGMNDLLAHSLNAHLNTIARCTVQADVDSRLARVMDHFWQQRRVARAMLTGDAGVAITRRLVGHLEAALDELWNNRQRRQGPPSSLVAEQLAAGQLAVLGEWLSGRASASSEGIAHLLHRTTHAAALAAF